MEDKDKYLIFGTGSGTDVFLANADEEDFDSILGFVDNNKEKQGTLYKNKIVFNPEEIKNIDYKKIIVSSLFYTEIKDKLVAQNIPPEKITTSIRDYSCSNLKQWLYLDKQRDNLKNKNFSIVSNYCWGLFLYRFFDIEYKTPFIGTYIHQYNYIKLLKNLKYYLNQPLSINFHPESNIHLGFLDDICICFPHTKDPQYTLKNWHKRLERFDFDNMFIHNGRTVYEHQFEDISEVSAKYMLSIDNNKSILYSKNKKIITSEPLDLVKWFNKEL